MSAGVWRLPNAIGYCPRETCNHVDCVAAWREWDEPCELCGKAITVGDLYFNRSPVPKVAHAVCVEAEAAK